MFEFLRVLPEAEEGPGWWISPSNQLEREDPWGSSSDLGGSCLA